MLPNNGLLLDYTVSKGNPVVEKRQERELHSD